jgi:hypothetical protein
MAISFPSNPSLNQTYTVGSSTWYWDGNQWSIYVNTSPTFINLTATGTLTAQTLSSPTLNNYVTNTALSSALSTVATTSALQTEINNRTNSSITINGISIQLNGIGTVPAAAGSLTGSTLHSTVINSSLTSVGTLTDLTVSGATSLNSTLSVTSDITGSANVNVVTLPTEKQHLTNKKYVDARAIVMAIGLS